MCLGQRPTATCARLFCEGAVQINTAVASAEHDCWRLNSAVDSQSMDKQRNLNCQDCYETSTENGTDQPLSQIRLPLGDS